MKIKIIIVIVILGIIGWFTYPKIKNYIITEKEENKEKVDSIIPPPLTPLPQTPDTIHIPLSIENGQIGILAKINGYPMRFTLDTGCSNVKIGIIDYLFLVKQGVVKDAPTDIATTINADGEQREAMSTKMDIELGGIKINGVNVLVGTNPSIDEPILLGHEVFENLGNIQIDYKNKILIVYK